MEKLSLWCVVPALLVCVTLSSAFAGGKKKEMPPPKAPVVTQASATAVTVAEEKTTKTFAITQFTEIFVNGQRATAADLKPGMTVTVTIGMDPSKASRINASGTSK
jgi:hypothetical protein